MASQPAASFDSVEFNSFIRGYHAYKDIWKPFVGETLLLKREPTKVRDHSAVAVMQETEVLGTFLITSVLLYLCFCDETVITGLLK